MARYKVGDIVVFDPEIASSSRGRKWARNKTPLLITAVRNNSYTVEPVNDVDADGGMSADSDRILGFYNKLHDIQAQSKKF